MASPTEYERLLNYGVSELRGLYDAITASFEGVRTKALALLAGEVAAVTFLFTAQTSIQTANIYFIYSFVLWGIGILLLVIAFLLFLSIVAPSQWHRPPETRDMRDIKKRFSNSPEEFLVYLKDEYTESITVCIRKLSVRSRRFVWAIISLSLGIFLVAILKFAAGFVIL